MSLKPICHLDRQIRNMRDRSCSRASTFHISCLIKSVCDVLILALKLSRFALFLSQYFAFTHSSHSHSHSPLLSSRSLEQNVDVVSGFVAGALRVSMRMKLYVKGEVKKTVKMRIMSFALSFLLNKSC